MGGDKAVVPATDNNRIIFLRHDFTFPLFWWTAVSRPGSFPRIEFFFGAAARSPNYLRAASHK
jgi:hypothetical protein